MTAASQPSRPDTDPRADPEGPPGSFLLRVRVDSFRIPYFGVCRRRVCLCLTMSCSSFPCQKHGGCTWGCVSCTHVTPQKRKPQNLRLKGHFRSAPVPWPLPWDQSRHKCVWGCGRNPVHRAAGRSRSSADARKRGRAPHLCPARERRTRLDRAHLCAHRRLCSPLSPEALGSGPRRTVPVPFPVTWRTLQLTAGLSFPPRKAPAPPVKQPEQLVLQKVPAWKFCFKNAALSVRGFF